MVVKSAGKTDVGLVRKSNEDCIKILPEKNLYIVCDGMGGHNAGEVASGAACDLVAGLYSRFFDALLGDERLRLPRMFPPSTDVLVKAVRIANHHIFQRAAADSSLSGMGTTIVAAAIEKDIITLLHVGDSRIYHYRNRTLTPLTVDHSWAATLEQTENISAEEARTLVNRNIITRALGVKETVEIDVGVRKIQENDTYLLCSDGLCGYVDDGDIREVMIESGGDLDQAVALLIQMANDRGGVDNVSVIALTVEAPVESSDLHKIETITIDAEPPEYYEAERQWAGSAAELPTAAPEPEPEPGPKKRAPMIGVALLVVLMAVILYLITKN